jgi:malonyl-CoA/methylmalonyl-CoA synthetase
MNANLYLTLSAGYADHLDRCCLRLPGGPDWNYREIDTLSAGLAAVLLETARPGDRVLVQVDKSPAAVALYLACLRAGLILVPLNTAYTETELDYFREDAQPAVEVDNAGLRALCEAAAAAEPGRIAEVSRDDVAAILYTSGTTGRPKGAMLSHGNLSSNATTLHRLWGFVDGDVLLHALPIYHVHGLFVALNTALLNASTILFLEKFDTLSVLEKMPEATVMMGVPTFYTRLLASPGFGPEQVGHMRLFISGSAPLTEQTFEEFEARTGQRILERYGMSETGMITSNPLVGQRQAGTVGYPLPGVELRICDREGEVLPPGEVGVVEVRGPNVFAGYWRMPEKTACEFRDDGFFITGDLGRLSADGRLTLAGREKDLIITGGLNVYPREVELCLDDIEGVLESAVIGVPHPDFGEAVVAVCVPRKDNLPDQAALQAQLADRLARFKQPKRYIQVAQLPRNSMGKVQKNLLRDQYRTLFQP